MHIRRPFGLLLFLFALAGCSFASTGAMTARVPRAIYLVQDPGQLSPIDLQAHPEVVKTSSFKDFKRFAQSPVALWIDKNSTRLVQEGWLDQPPQMYYPLVLVGYNDTLYSFRDTLTVCCFSGSIFDWSTHVLEPGFSVIQREGTNGSLSGGAFIQGYSETPRAQAILDITNALLDHTLKPTSPALQSAPTTSPPASPSPPSVELAPPDTWTPVPQIPALTSTPFLPAPAATYTPSPFAAPAGFALDIYPAPAPTAPETILFLSAGCPNSTGLESAKDLSSATALDVLRNLAAGDYETARRASDPSYWPLLDPNAKPGTVRADGIGKPRPAASSPYADLIRNACGQNILDRSWWVTRCPGSCADPNVARSLGLIGHFYLILRNGNWLVWASK